MCENRSTHLCTNFLAAVRAADHHLVAAAHVLRAAAHGVCAFGVDLAPKVHVYLGPVDDDPEGATAAGRRRRRTGAVLHYCM